MRALAMGLALLLLVTSLGCQKRRQSNEEKTLVNAYKLIDAQRTDEAISLLEAELERMDPNAAHFVPYKMALGSAYAHKAGIKVQRFGKMLKIGKIDTKFSDNIKVDRDKKITKPQAVDNFLKSVSKMIIGISKLTGVYTAIPTIDPEDEKYLVYSLKILDYLPADRISAGDALYRAVIRVIYLKHYMATRILDDGIPVELEVETCSINFDKINETLQKLTTSSAKILDDLAQAQPKKAKGYKASSESLARAASDLTVLSTFASLVDDATMTLSKQALVETGMRKLLKCKAAPVSSLLPSQSSAAQ